MNQSVIGIALTAAVSTLTVLVACHDDHDHANATHGHDHASSASHTHHAALGGHDASHTHGDEGHDDDHDDGDDEHGPHGHSHADAASIKTSAVADKVFLGQQKSFALEPPLGASRADGFVRDAQAEVQKLPKKHDTWVLLGQAWVQKARADYDEESWMRANAAADVALNLRPESPLALDLKGLALLNGHRFAQAKALAESVLAEHPGDVMALGILGDAQLELGDMAGAIDAIDRMMDVKPNLPSYSRSAWLKWLNGDAEAAKEAWRLAFDAGRGAKDKEPTTWVLVETAKLFFHQGDYEGAESGVDLALEYNPGYPPALVVKAQCRMAAGDAHSAVKLLKRADASHPNVETAYLLGNAHKLAGHAAASERAWTMAEKRAAAHDGLGLARVLLRLERKPAVALQAARRELLTRGGPEVKDAYAMALLQNGEAAEALKVIEELRALGTPDAAYAYHEAVIRLALGQRDRGLALIEGALKLNPHWDLNEAGRARAALEKS